MASYFSAGSGGSGLMGGSSLLGASKSGATAEDMAFGVALSGSDVAKNPCPCCQLSFRQRLIGFVSCFSLGFLLSCIATTKLWTSDYTGFGSLYSVGNVLALCSTGFLMGPVTQIKNMFHSNRIGATLAYLVMIAVTLSVAFAYEGGGKALFVILCVIIQSLALTWYTLSYIPFARDMVLK